jgi:hypothetical protein
MRSTRWKNTASSLLVASRPMLSIVSINARMVPEARSLLEAMVPSAHQQVPQKSYAPSEQATHQCSLSTKKQHVLALLALLLLLLYVRSLVFGFVHQ